MSNTTIIKTPKYQKLIIQDDFKHPEIQRRYKKEEELFITIANDLSYIHTHIPLQHHYQKQGNYFSYLLIKNSYLQSFSINSLLEFSIFLQSPLTGIFPYFILFEDIINFLYTNPYYKLFSTINVTQFFPSTAEIQELTSLYDNEETPNSIKTLIKNHLPVALLNSSLFQLESLEHPKNYLFNHAQAILDLLRILPAREISEEQFLLLKNQMFSHTLDHNQIGRFIRDISEEQRNRVFIEINESSDDFLKSIIYESSFCNLQK